MRWIVRLLAAVVVLAAGMGQAQQAAPRYALVIGNAAYQTPGWQLINPVNDANLMESRLKELGFQVTPLMNATKAQMEAAMNTFTSQVSAGGADAVGVFYYAGHGVEHDGANLLVPVDVTARSMDELRYQAPPMQFLLRDMARAGNKVNIIILDACRNLPLPAGSRAGPAGGLAELADVPDNVLIAYATRPGLTAPDNPGQTNSVFTRTLSDALARNPTDTAVNLFAGVQARVFDASGSLQRPEFRSGLLRAPDWRFAAPSTRAAPAVDPELERLRRENDALHQREQNKPEYRAEASNATQPRSSTQQSANRQPLPSMAVSEVRTAPGISTPSYYSSYTLSREVETALNATRKFRIVSRSSGEGEAMADELQATMRRAVAAERATYLVSIEVVGVDVNSETRAIPNLLGKSTTRTVGRIEMRIAFRRSTDGTIVSRFPVDARVATTAIVHDTATPLAAPAAGSLGFVDLAKSAGKNIADRLLDEVYPVLVIQRQGGIVYLNRGEDSGYRMGEVLRVFTSQGRLVDPYTHEDLGPQELQLGTIRVTDMRPRVTMAEVVSETGGAIGQGAIVRKQTRVEP